MSSLGTVDRKIANNQITYGKLNEFLFKADFTLSVDNYNLIINELLSFGKDYAEWTDADVNRALERCSSFRFTFLTAAEKVTSLIIDKEHELNIFYANASEKAESEITDTKGKQKANGVPASIMRGISKQTIDDWIIKNKTYETGWLELKQELHHLKAKRRQLMELRDCMTQRSSDLRPIAFMRLEQQKWENYQINKE